jgi:hypothetical protein
MRDPVVVIEFVVLARRLHHIRQPQWRKTEFLVTGMAGCGQLDVE